MSMFCYQCEQTAGGTGCTKQGVCGKDAETAAMQDLLIFACKGLARHAKLARDLGKKGPAVDAFVQEVVFATLTNVNFAPERFVEFVNQVQEYTEHAKAAIVEAGGTPLEDLEPAIPAGGDLKELLAVGVQVGILADPDLDNDMRGLRELIIYALKGIAAYAHHARDLGHTDDAVDDFVYEALAATTDDSLSVEDLVAVALKAGEVNLKAMEMLDAGHAEALGAPEPSPVYLGAKAGPGILVSGHDMLDLLALLKQTEGTGVNVYTHGEMLPAHMYPELKEYPHLVGNYGGAWQNQRKEFEEFPGPIVMTTNCIQKPKESYKDRIFTLGPVGWPGVKHLGHSRDFSEIIELAQSLPPLEEQEGKTILTGFNHRPVLAIADKIIDAVKSGKIRHFFLIGGCDGARPGRNYYTEFAEAVPDDCVILTLGCAKYRFNKLDFGEIADIPRLLDCGQCNDAYSAIVIASALAEAFDCGVNDLPLSMIVSWYEQKAVAILLSLLHLGTKDIRLGPTLPAFITPNILDVLVENFDLKPITTVEEDLRACLEG